MNFDDLSPELQEKAKACTSPEELMALAESEGFELSDDDLQAIDGGIVSDKCPCDVCVDVTCGKDHCSGFRCTMYNCTDFSCTDVGCRSITYN